VTQQPRPLGVAQRNAASNKHYWTSHRHVVSPFERAELRSSAVHALSDSGSNRGDAQKVFRKFGCLEAINYNHFKLGPLVMQTSVQKPCCDVQVSGTVPD
jgi:hypothetical protein